MAENLARAQEPSAVDVLYFPPEQHQAEEDRCREHIAPVLDLMHESGVSRVFITQCKRWSCDRRWMCESSQLDDVLLYTSPHPQEFVGIGSYHPLDIANSIHQAEIGIRHHGFRGILIHPASFGIALKDRRMYPLFAKAIDWKVPVIVDVKQAENEIAAITAEEVEQIASDFADAKLVIARADWSKSEFVRIAEEYPNVYFCFDAAAIASSRLGEFVTSPLAHSRCMWGSNGLPWKQSIAEMRSSGFPDGLLALNAIRVFGLEHLPARTAKPYAVRSQHLARIVAE
jgi:uncharacterized protein